jgi:hypothetical protein
MGSHWHRSNLTVAATFTTIIGIFNLNRYDFMALGDGPKQGAGNFAAHLMPWVSSRCGRMYRSIKNYVRSLPLGY